MCYEQLWLVSPFRSPRGLLSLTAGWLLGATLSAVAAERPAPTLGAPAEAAWKKLEVRDPALGDELKSKQGRFIADYGSFQLWAVPAGQAKEFAARRGAKVRLGD